MGHAASFMGTEATRATAKDGTQKRGQGEILEVEGQLRTESRQWAP